MIAVTPMVYSATQRLPLLKLISYTGKVLICPAVTTPRAFGTKRRIGGDRQTVPAGSDATFVIPSGVRRILLMAEGDWIEAAIELGNGRDDIPLYGMFYTTKGFFEPGGQYVASSPLLITSTKDITKLKMRSDPTNRIYVAHYF